MNSHTRAFVFEQLLQYCSGNPVSAGKLLGVERNPMDFNCQFDQLPEHLCSKYSGSWWEVAVDPVCGKPDFAKRHCVYLADSIEDAVRRRSKADSGYWQNALEYFDSMYANMYEVDEECV